MNRKIASKRKAREERIRKQKHINSINSLYPEFIFANEHVVEPEYVKIVKELVKGINFQTFEFHSEYHDIFHRFLKDTVKLGYREAFYRGAGVDSDVEAMRKKMIVGTNTFVSSTKASDCALNLNDEKSFEFFTKLQHFGCVHEGLVSSLGDKILFSRFESEFFKYYPEQGFRICFVANKICILFQRVAKVGTGLGFGYQYMVPRKIKWVNKEYNLVFKNHALSRLIQRFSLNGRSCYSSYILLYEFFRSMKYKFDYSAGGKPFIQFYFPAFRKIYPTVKQIHKDDPNIVSINGEKYPEATEKQYYIKCFSSPISVIDNNMYIITALLPGYRPTPESKILEKAGIKNMKLKDRIRHAYFSEIDIRSEEYADGLKFFHSNGVPQVFLEKAVCEFPRNHHDLITQPFDYILNTQK